MARNRYRVPPRTQGPLQPPQTRQYNPHQQWQLPPQQIGPRIQYVNSVLHQPSYYTPPLMAYPSWPSNHHIRQNNHNDLFYHLPVVGPHSPILQQALQIPTHIIGRDFEQHLHSSLDENSGYRYSGLYNHHMHGIDLDTQYEGASTDAQVYDEPSPLDILWNSQIPIAENHDGTHNLDDREPPIDTANTQTLNNGLMDPNKFHTLPGYRGCKNNYGLFECFDDCKHNRLEEQGFPRRANLLAHLRSCHGQNIPRGARVNLS